MEFIPYVRQVQYYETDQMAIVHHSNYIRWFEEARLDLMAQMGVSYRAMEEQGILIPVVDVSCKYLISAKYGDTVRILPFVTEYSGVKMCFRYEVRGTDDNELLATGTSTHCFINSARRPVSLKRQSPNLHQLFSSLLTAE